MSAKNGAGSASAVAGTKKFVPVRRADYVPEMIDVYETERDGEPVMLKGYVHGRRCPGTIKNACSAVWDEYVEATTEQMEVPVTDHETGDVRVEIQEQFRPNNIAWRNMLKGELMALIPELREDEADELSGDDLGEGGAVAILRALQYLKPEEESENADPQTEAMNDESSTDASSPNSSPSTAALPKRG
jgi:hypothetical protein